MNSTVIISTTKKKRYNMSCKGFLQFLLEVINFVFLLLGLAMIGYGIYMVVTYDSSAYPSDMSYFIYKSSPSPQSLSPLDSNDIEYTIYEQNFEYKVDDNRHAYKSSRESSPLSTPPSPPLLKLRRFLLQSVRHLKPPSVSSYWDNLPYAWFLYVVLFLGAIITLIACSGYIAASTAYESCLHCYCLFVLIAIAAEVSVAAFICLNGSWQKIIPTDSTGQLDILEEYIQDRLEVFKWIALAVMIIQVLALILTVILKALSCDASWNYDTDDEYLSPRILRQQLLNRQTSIGMNTNIDGYSIRSSQRGSRSPRLR